MDPTAAQPGPAQAAARPAGGLGPPRRLDFQIAGALLDAYRQGAFPMASLAPGSEEDGGIRFYRPDPRAILPLDGLRISRSLRQRLRSERFIIRSDTAIEAVIRACAEPRPGTWLNDELIELYLALARAGHVHTVEAWVDGPGAERLVGGLYGVTLGGLFAGESMFSRPRQGGSDASKVCLAALTGHLRLRGFTLHDVQILNPHLERLGAVEIPGNEYLRRLEEATAADVVWGGFDDARVLSEFRL
jgi:leucyl/phenylalanyl-tRNA--protein transferase